MKFSLHIPNGTITLEHVRPGVFTLRVEPIAALEPPELTFDDIRELWWFAVDEVRALPQEATDAPKP